MFKQGCFPCQAPDFGGMRSFQWLCLWLLLSLHSDEPVSTDLTQMQPWESREARAEQDWSALPTSSGASLSQPGEGTHNPAGPQGTGSQDSSRKPSGEAGGRPPAGSVFTFLSRCLLAGSEAGCRSQAWVGYHCSALWAAGSTSRGGLKTPPHEG